MNLLVELGVIFLPTSCFFCPRIARIDTNSFNGLNGDRVGRTNFHEFKWTPFLRRCPGVN